MSYTRVDYWEEAAAHALEWAGVAATAEQIKAIGESLEVSADNIGQAFYSPPSSDRTASIERDWKQRYDDLKRDFEKYQGNAEAAVKKALRQPSNANVVIGAHGEVTRFDGRTEVIQ